MTMKEILNQISGQELVESVVSTKWIKKKGSMHFRYHFVTLNDLSIRSSTYRELRITLMSRMFETVEISAHKTKTPRGVCLKLKLKEWIPNEAYDTIQEYDSRLVLRTDVAVVCPKCGLIDKHQILPATSEDWELMCWNRNCLHRWIHNVK